MKTTPRCLAYVLYVLFIPSLILAQGAYLKRGESGWGVSSSMTFSEISSGYGGAFGFSYKGVVDLALAVGRSYPTGSFNGKTYANFVAPRLTFFLQKQDTVRKSFSVALSMSYQFINLRQPVYVYSGNYRFPQYREEIQTTHTDAGSISLAFIRNLRADSNPILHMIVSIEVARSGIVNQFGILAGLSVGIRVSQVALVMVTPTIGGIIIHDRKYLVSGLEFGVVI